MSFCLSSRDEPDRSRSPLDEDNDDHGVLEKPDSDLAFLAIVPTCVERDVL